MTTIRTTLAGLATTLLMLATASAALAQPVTMPFTEDFEGEIQCPTGCDPTCDLLGLFGNDPTHQLDWTSDSGGTGSSATGPSIDHTLGDATGRYLYVETSCSGSGYPDKISRLVSPMIDVSESAALLSFWYHLYGDAQGDLSIDVQEPVTAADAYVDQSSGLLVATNADFSDVEVGGHVEIIGSSSGNDGVYTVAAVNSTTELVLVEGLAADEVFVTVGYFDADAAWTEDVWGPTTDDVDAWQESGIVALGGPSADLRFRIRNVSGTTFTSDAAVDDITVFSAVDDEVVLSDVGIVANCADPAAEVSATIQNLGSNDQVDLQVQYQLGSAAPVVETIPLVSSFEVLVYTFAQTVDLSAGGAFTLTVTALVTADTNLDNNELTVTGDALAMLDAANYFEDFEGGAGGWMVDPDQDVNGNWELGLPADSVINGAASGSNAWVTGLNGNYPASMVSAVIGPCMDFAALTDPEVQLKVWYEAEFSWDGALLQYSTDGGLTWVNLGGVGDDLNWYTDGTINGLPAPQDGWSGRADSSNGSGGWLLTSHEAGALAGLSGVRLRVLFGSDGSVHDEGFAFDDVRVFEGVPGLAVWQEEVVPADGLVWPGDEDVPTLGFAAMALDATQTIELLFPEQSLEIDTGHLTGTLWLDDGSGAFEAASDTPLVVDEAVAADGTLFDLTGAPVVLAPYEWATFWVTYDLSPAALPGASLWASLLSGDVTSTPDPPRHLTDPITGPEYLVHGPADSLPLYDAFDEAGFNRTTEDGGGEYPQASGVGGAISLVTTVNDALVYEAESADIADLVNGGNITVVANSAPDLAAVVFPSGEAVGAIDWLFDFSGLDAGDDLVRIDFAWNHVNEEAQDADGVFVSIDGGATWIAKALEFDFSAPIGIEWSTASLDLSTALLDAGVNFTAEVVVRVQVMGSEVETLDGLLLDDFAFGFYQQLEVIDESSVAVVDGGTWDAGSVEATFANGFSWSLENIGDFDLPLEPGMTGTSSPTNVSGLMVTPPSADVLAPGGADSVSVGFVVDGAGAFSFDLELVADDPRVGDAFTFTVSGLGYVQPELWVETDFGPTTDADLLTVVGSTTGVASALSVQIGNDGTGPLTLAGVAPDYISFANASNVVPTVSTPPTLGIVASGGSETAELSLVPSSDGAWSVDVVLASDDPTTSVFTFTVAGDATVPAIALDVLSGGIANGGSDVVGDVRIGAPQSKTWTISNVGSADLLLEGAPLVALSGQVNVTAAVTTDPTSPIASAGTTTFVVEYTVPATGAWSVDLAIDTNDPDDDPFVFTLQGAGVEPEINVAVDGNAVTNGDVIALGEVPALVALDALFEVTNLGSEILDLDGMPDPIAIANEVNAAVSVPTQPPATIGLGLTESFDVAWTVSAEGDFIFDVVIANDDIDEDPFTVTFEGTGVLADYTIARDATVVLNGGADALGDVLVETFGLTWSIDNAGTGSLGLTGDPDPVALSNATNVTASVTTQPGATVAAAGSESFDVEFAPDALGAFSFDVTVETDSPTEPTYTFTVSGTAVEPDLQVRRGAILLADGDVEVVGDLVVGDLVDFTYDLENVGTATLTLTGEPDLVTVENVVNAIASITEQPEESELGVGATGEFTVQFGPEADGAFGFDLVIASDDPDTGAFTVSIEGVGVSPVIEVARDDVVIEALGADVLDEWGAGEAMSFTWTITNVGTWELALVGEPDAVEIGDLVGAEVVVTQPAELAVAPEVSTSFDLEITPEVGEFSFVVIVRNDDDDFQMTVQGTGEDTSGDDDDDDGGGGTGCDCNSSLAGRGGSPLALLGLFVGLVAMRRRR
jgi:hypothetical protein